MKHHEALQYFAHSTLKLHAMKHEDLLQCLQIQLSSMKRHGFTTVRWRSSWGLSRVCIICKNLSWVVQEKLWSWSKTLMVVTRRRRSWGLYRPGRQRRRGAFSGKPAASTGQYHLGGPLLSSTACAMISRASSNSHSLVLHTAAVSCRLCFTLVWAVAALLFNNATPASLLICLMESLEADETWTNWSLSCSFWSSSISALVAPAPPMLTNPSLLLRLLLAVSAAATASGGVVDPATTFCCCSVHLELEPGIAKLEDHELNMMMDGFFCSWKSLLQRFSHTSESSVSSFRFQEWTTQLLRQPADQIQQAIFKNPQLLEQEEIRTKHTGLK